MSGHRSDATSTCTSPSTCSSSSRSSSFSHFALAGVDLPVSGDPLCLELFCGSAGLTHALSAANFRAVGVDRDDCVHLPKATVIRADLTDPVRQRELRALLLHPDLHYVHFGPPCGTASRARERPLSESGHGPLPLRSEQEPRGLTGLTPQSASRVRAANVLYDLTVDAANTLTSRGVIWTIENPDRSLFWWLPNVVDLLQGDCADVTFDACMHGSRRKKRSRLRCRPVAPFKGLEAHCDNSHSHLPWGVSVDGDFATASEAEYPAQLCSALAACVAGTRTRPLRPPPSLPDERAAAGVQPARAAPALVPELKCILHLHIEATYVQQFTSMLGKTTSAETTIGAHVLPPHARILRVIGQDGGSSSMSSPRRIQVFAWDRSDKGAMYIGRRFRDKLGIVHPASRWANPYPASSCVSQDECIAKYESHLLAIDGYPEALRELSGMKLACHCRPWERCHGDLLIEHFCKHFLDGEQATVVVGVYASPAEFLEASASVAHPSARIAADDLNLEAALWLLTSSPTAVRQRWSEILAGWRARAAEISEREAVLHASLDPVLSNILKSKRLLLFGEALRAAGFPKPDDLIHRMAKGFDVVGKLPTTGVFPPQKPTRAASVESLWARAREARETVVAKLGPTSDPELDIAVTDITADEVKRGWLLGPRSETELTAAHGLWVPSFRFGIRQGDSVRAIDDYSLSGQNGAVSVAERIDMGGIDTVVGLARLLAGRSAGDSISFEKADGSVLQGAIHKEWTNLSILGKTFDLSKAYRQLGRNPAHGSLTIVGTWNAHLNMPQFYEQPVLAFGATSSVTSFCWCARALWHLLVTSGVVLTHYVDDYPILCPAEVAADCEAFVTGFFDVFGWALKDHEPFAQTFVTLGVQITVANPVQVTHKPGRLASIAREVDSLVSLKTLTPAAASSLRGRLQFSRAQVFARLGGPSLRMLGIVAAGNTSADAIAAALTAVYTLIAIFEVARPRAVPVEWPAPVRLFTDGAYENGSMTVGAVIATPAGGLQMFGLQVPECICALFGAPDKKQLVGQAELLPVVLSKWTWPELLDRQPLLLFVDNEAAKYGLIRGSSSCDASAALIGLSSEVDAVLGVAQWVSRVPTASNIGDGPSRLSFAEAQAHGAVLVKVRGASGRALAWPELAIELKERMGG